MFFFLPIVYQSTPSFLLPHCEFLQHFLLLPDALQMNALECLCVRLLLERPCVRRRVDQPCVLHPLLHPLYLSCGLPPLF